jgi:Tol biopolymer transport system component
MKSFPHPSGGLLLLAFAAGPALGQKAAPRTIVDGTSPVLVRPLERVSVSSAGVPGDLSSRQPSLRGRIVAFASLASNLVPLDTNGVQDIFVHDRESGITERVSVDSAGAEGNGESLVPSISADGRFVAFESLANDLVPFDGNGWRDVFVHDRLTGTTTRVSVSSTGVQGNHASREPWITPDGRYVAFWSVASNLVPGDTNGSTDAFVRDLQSGTTTRVSVDSAGAQANSGSSDPSISADGRFVAFVSWATNLVALDTNGFQDIFVRDLLTGTTTRASVSSAGTESNGHSFSPSISGDGSRVAFESDANNLVPDSNPEQDVFVHELATGTTTLVSVDSAGVQGDDRSTAPALSDDGLLVAFESLATNLVPQDTNGARDVFVRDLVRGITRRVSVDAAGRQVAAESAAPSLSPDGRHVSFWSAARYLVPEDLSPVPDVFVYDLFWSAR